jgi:hypothetical protein
MNSDRNKNRPDPNERDINENRLERHSSIPGDLPDSEKDRKELKTEETYIDLPDVKDIPGQEFVHTLPAGSLADTTPSSDDEEGRNVFDRDDSEDLRKTGDSSDVRRAQRIALRDTDYMPTTDENRLNEANMDNKDFQNAPLNEKGFGQEERTGDDLDVPGSDDETRTTSLGQGDEENQYFSLGSIHNDSLDEGMDEKNAYKDVDLNDDDVPVNNG